MQRGGRKRRRGRRASAVAVALILAAASWLPAVADPASADRRPRFSTSSGGDVTLNSRSGYAGGVWAVGGDLDAEGFRVKALGGYGAYAYDSVLELAGGAVPWRFVGHFVFADIMGGWQKRWNEWTAKTYAGVQYIEHALSPDDPGNDVKGARWGAKVQLELWRDLGPRSWLSLDASYASAFGDYCAQARLGRRLSRRWSLGLEGGGLGNEDYDAGRGGAFLRYHFDKAELTLSGGATGDYRAEETSGYVTLGLYRRH